MTWTAPDFIDQLATSVAARPAIGAFTDPEVLVLDYSPSQDENLPDIIVIGYEADDENEPDTIGNRVHKETVILRCALECRRPGAGSEVAKAGRDRAALLLGEVDAQLRNDYPDVGDQTVAPAPRISSRRMFQYPSMASKGSPLRVCNIDFSITYSARTSV